MGELVRATDEEAGEGETLVERRPRQSIRIDIRGSLLASRVAVFLHCTGTAGRCRLCNTSSGDGLSLEVRVAQRHSHLRARAYLDIQLLDAAEFAGESGANSIRVMRLDPAFQELRRHRDVGDAVFDAHQLETSEPRAVDGLAKFGTQAPTGAGPGFFNALSAIFIGTRLRICGRLLCMRDHCHHLETGANRACDGARRAQPFVNRPGRMGLLDA